jgi:hypothetical protein
MTRAPEWSEEEFRLLLSQLATPAEELQQELPQRSVEAIELVRNAVADYRRRGESPLLSQMMRRIVDEHARECVCCQHGTPTAGPRVCPLCGHQFQGNGWDGIDAHWRSRHRDVMSYEAFWQSLCAGHRD